MSHDTGEIWSLDGRLFGYFEYNGTVDVAGTRVYLTQDELWANWRKDYNASCTCGATGEKVVLFTYYGGGSYWDGRVCHNCMAITDGIRHEDETDGHPFRESADRSALMS